MIRPARKTTPQSDADAQREPGAEGGSTRIHVSESQPVTLRAANADADNDATTTGAAPARPGRLVRFSRGLLKSLLPFAMIAAGVSGYKYLKATRPEIPKQPNMERAFAVDTVTAKRTSSQPLLTLYGTTVAGRQFDIRALVAGRIVKTHDELREGGRINAGETLLAIDSFEYVSARDEARAQRAETTARLTEQQASLKADQTSLEHAKAQLALAKADVDRAVELTSRGNLSERTLDDRRQIVLQRQQAADQLANSISVWEARIAQTRTTTQRLDVTIARAERRLEETELKAPFDAYVTEVTAQVGRITSINDKIATLIDRNWIEAQFSLTDSQFGRIVSGDGKLEGRPVEVRWTLGGETFTYPATITRIAARIASANGGIDVFARVLDPMKPVPLRPGAFVELSLADVLFDDVVRIPNPALYDGNTVYVVKDSRLDPRPVTVVGSNGSDLLVRADIADGEEIVTTRMSTPGKGVLVKRMPVAPEVGASADVPAGSIRQSRAP